jgi:hypothetical protein
MHLVGFIIRIYHDARSSECQIDLSYFFSTTFARKARSINFREHLFSRSPVVSCTQTEAAILVGGQQRFECAEYLQ